MHLSCSSAELRNFPVWRNSWGGSERLNLFFHFWLNTRVHRATENKLRLQRNDHHFIMNFRWLLTWLSQKNTPPSGSLNGKTSINVAVVSSENWLELKADGPNIDPYNLAKSQWSMDTDVQSGIRSPHLYVYLISTYKAKPEGKQKPQWMMVLQNNCVLINTIEKFWHTGKVSVLF